MTSARELLPVAAGEFGRRVHAVRPGDWTNATPNTDWAVRDLINHLVAEHLWASPLLVGQGVHDVGDRFDGDVLGADPVTAWDTAIEASLQAWAAAADEDTVTLSVGPARCSATPSQMLMDLTVHSWDLARGIGADDRIDPACVEHVLSYVEEHTEDLQAYGLFDPSVPTDATDAQDLLLARLGRHP